MSVEHHKRVRLSPDEISTREADRIIAVERARDEIKKLPGEYSIEGAQGAILGINNQQAYELKSGGEKTGILLFPDEPFWVIEKDTFISAHHSYDAVHSRPFLLKFSIEDVNSAIDLIGELERNKFGSKLEDSFIAPYVKNGKVEFVVGNNETIFSSLEEARRMALDDVRGSWH